MGDRHGFIKSNSSWGYCQCGQTTTAAPTTTTTPTTTSTTVTTTTTTTTTTTSETTTVISGGGGGGGGEEECEGIDDFKFREHKFYTPVFYFQDSFQDPIVNFFSNELRVDIMR